MLAWTMEAQADDPAPSTTVDRDGLDVLQADAAAAVAGTDRLVVVVGPAGTGKTTTLQRAVEDLAAWDRPVFGVAPTAKAARVLERETGMDSDTVAKLLYEWHRADRPPHARYRLPAGTTLIVDEAGMIGTASLHQLVDLADAHGWRMALVGDPRQLQAVGRGGLFNELCSITRVHELSHIHRFHERWEAAASLRLRAGDRARWTPTRPTTGSSPADSASTSIGSPRSGSASPPTGGAAPSRLPGTSRSTRSTTRCNAPGSPSVSSILMPWCASPAASTPIAAR